MLALTLFLLLLCAVLVRKQHVRSAAALALAPLAILASASPPITQWLLDLAQDAPSSIAPAPHPRTAIVVLGAGIDQDAHSSRPSLAGNSRLMAAAQRYLACERNGETCAVLVSGGATTPDNATEADVYARELIALGVPAGHIVREQASVNTWQNARNSSRIIQHDSLRVVLVTSGLHLKRSLIYFRHFGVVAEGLPSDRLRAAAGWLPSAYNLLLIEVMVHEYIGVLRYRVYNGMGWNEESIRQDSVTPATTIRALPHSPRPASPSVPGAHNRAPPPAANAAPARASPRSPPTA
ncbi:Uncharacterized SAM-binding protein YcdF, DUF218 family [Stenotrophomonas indicatrix]|jgi:uncharacterized SAM-binding protein YcdF (DUF218 family)|uniref:Uncharacterized SAM-binding protein YcdF, DUF218 family n=1 Tax=Stenotrophomonas indicatrix TaxID=2045451 RepID=A0A1W1GYV4_9GAMM|nr:putative exported lipoprotein [Stenotrophomonas indicatrix]SLM24549.1 Uncharacterized SAM-binding protein YcdF, DUF218 family [Stenotrophomonas indicatrix]